ncbi:glycosyltransferase family protein [Anabaena azotica]|uniref:Glycosyltransferase n=1 Tax=Anabaena azotica FACHB-119 TaxID=947527 RepID=A0ABR8D2Z8_9NOST|nr:glycosyltransferase [Anabaena azotica]MBD2501510.1 glycosyltransferase [Anabaena azotica FACHB-119]
MQIKPINLFYEEPESDRWLPLDRYPRRVIRRLIRGKPQPGGMMIYFINLCLGLDRLGIPYQVNKYSYMKKHPEEVACIIGKPHVLYKIKWHNPIIFGPAVYSHPSDEPLLFQKAPIQKLLVSCEWLKDMYKTLLHEDITVWPSGINTYRWQPAAPAQKDIDILIYNKIRWQYDSLEAELLIPIQSRLDKMGLRVENIRYGFYKEEEYELLLKRSKAMIFLCEHETQGFAYQQALSAGVPILAWDRGGFWQDPTYFPHKAKFAPVSSVPYWDHRCGIKFQNINEFPTKLAEFLDKLESEQFAPRDYILENLSLEQCAKNYVEILHQVQGRL